LFGTTQIYCIIVKQIITPMFIYILEQLRKCNGKIVLIHFSDTMPMDASGLQNVNILKYNERHLTVQECEYFMEQLI